MTVNRNPLRLSQLAAGSTSVEWPWPFILTALFDGQYWKVAVMRKIGIGIGIGFAQAVGVLCLVILTGCSVASAPDPTSPPVDIVEEAPAPAPTPVEETGVVFSGTLPFTDSDGYQLEIAYEVVIDSPLMTDVSNEKPGFTTLLVPGSSSLVLTNVTNGRNYEFTSNNIKLELALGYPSSSPICQDRALIGEECYIPIRTTVDWWGGSDIDNFEIGSGESFEFTTYSLSWNEESERVGPGITVAQIPEAISGEYVAGFAQPSHVYVTGRGIRLSSIECRFGPNNAATLFFIGSDPALSACPW